MTVLSRAVISKAIAESAETLAAVSETISATLLLTAAFTTVISPAIAEFSATLARDSDRTYAIDDAWTTGESVPSGITVRFKMPASLDANIFIFFIVAGISPVDQTLRVFASTPCARDLDGSDNQVITVFPHN
ncbi:MAG: hypothetical protein HON48_14290 [Desulfobacula sp.]|nr:hypothetical protein [Desulfobacula sp.]